MNYENDPEFLEWRRRVETELVPKLAASGATVSLLPEGEPDVKFAVELGLSILMDKPIVAVASPGTRVPPKVRRVADAVIEVDLNTPEGEQQLMHALESVLPNEEEEPRE